MQYDIFVAYGDPDGVDFAEHIKSYLESLLSKRVFVAKQEFAGGERVWPEIQQAIKESTDFILVLTPWALRSEWVKREVQYALRLRKYIIPCKYASVTRENKAKISSKLLALHDIDFSSKEELARKLYSSQSKATRNPENPVQTIQPYLLDGAILTFRRFVEMLKADELADEERITHIGFVYGTSRHKTKCRHAGFISDSLFVPEIS
ncbi:unnamed protein product, partial [marine sediment metagenome]